MPLQYRDLSKMIDHSLLHPTMTDEQVSQGLDLSLRYDVATACVKPYHTAMAREAFSHSDVKVCTVIGFPHGNSTTGIKLVEAESAVLAGAAEIDMVVNIGKVLGGQWDYVEREISVINQLVVHQGAILKVIFENDYLQDAHIIRLCEVCSNAQVAFVKTSTGYGFVKQPDGAFSYKGATESHLKLMRLHTDSRVEIKAAGGVRTLDDLLKVRSWGVSRVGATATAAMLDEARNRFGWDNTQPHTKTTISTTSISTTAISTTAISTTTEDY
jgi:deoxyribose-phosphate aldolase